MNWLIYKASNEYYLYAESDGIWLRKQTPQVQSFNSTRLGRHLDTLMPQLHGMELTIKKNSDYRIDYKNFTLLETQHSIDAFNDIAPWAPFSIEIETSGSPGTDSFKYIHRYYSGKRRVDLKRCGCFLKHRDEFFRIDAQTFSLIEAIDAFQSLPKREKASSEAFVKFAAIKELSEVVGAQLDAFLKSERVIIPLTVGLDLIADKDGKHITFVPKIDGAPQEEMRKAFMNSGDVDEVYSMDDSKGGRVRVVLNETQREVLRRMQRVRHVTGVKKAEILRDPHQVFDGVAGAVEIDLGPRVKGVGDFPFVSHPYLQRSSTGIFEGVDRNQGDGKRFSAGLKCQYADGTVEDVSFKSQNQLMKLHSEARAARKNGKGTIDFRNKSIIVDDRFIKGLDELVARVIPNSNISENKFEPRQYLLIYTNESELDFEETEKVLIGNAPNNPPRSIKKDILQQHQLEGLVWLQKVFRLQRRGCLLADDMGLGKTLQVLAFLAWIIEEGKLDSKKDKLWDPILIVAPVTLLENETWVEDMQKFFADEGDIFKPWVILHGPRLKEFRRKDSKGRETVVGEAVLDLDLIREHRVVLTNYETVVNYQHSFAKMKEQWSVVVTDEAHEYKTPSTKISHALKSLSPSFRIACTGTPVETRLMDIWNIFDFLQPGKLLGSGAEFSNQYEKPLETEGHADASTALRRLKEKLQLGQPNAFVLRREKTRLKGLPLKHEHIIPCELSPKQREWHLDIVERARVGGEDNHPFSLLQQLMKVYQHPGLAPRYEPLDPADAIAQCPKLDKVLQCLRNIKSRGEKALLFTRNLNMQQILVSALGTEFNLEIDIINGATSHHGDTGNTRKTRHSIMKKFKESSGFNVIVLSPDVAGIGLTIIEANHVIHYGRWWNPAKEAQATDRVYRIGQTRDVHVYYPIAKDPNGVFETFDEKLDKIIRGRQELASEFLTPMPSEEELGKELLENIREATGDSGSGHILTMEDVRTSAWEHFEALIAVLEEKRGNKVILTPRAGDDKADVLAFKGKILRIIQCKHSKWQKTVDNEVLNEIINAIDIYRELYLKSLTQSVHVDPVVSTNGTFSTDLKNNAQAKGVKLIDNSDLWNLLKDTPCTFAEIVQMEDRRLASMKDVQAKIKSLMPL